MPPPLLARDTAGCLLVSLAGTLAQVCRGLQTLLLGPLLPSAGTGRLLVMEMESLTRSCLGGGGGQRRADGEVRRAQSKTLLTSAEE